MAGVGAVCPWVGCSFFFLSFANVRLVCLVEFYDPEVDAARQVSVEVRACLSERV